MFPRTDVAMVAQPRHQLVERQFVRVMQRIGAFWGTAGWWGDANFCSHSAIVCTAPSALVQRRPGAAFPYICRTQWLLSTDSAEILLILIGIPYRIRTGVAAVREPKIHLFRAIAIYLTV